METEVYSQIPYEALRQDLSELGVTSPDIQVIFNVNRHHGLFHFADLELIAQDIQMGVMPWGITVVLDEHQEEHHCRVMFDAGMYCPSGMRRFISRYRQLLDAVSRDPGSSIRDLVAKAT